MEARRSQGASRTQEEPGGLFLAVFAGFLLVSDGPMVQLGLYISGLGGLDKAYQDHSKGSLEDVWKLSRPPKWS